MANDFFTSFELIAVLTAYCVLFIPLFAWVVSQGPEVPAANR